MWPFDSVIDVNVKRTNPLRFRFSNTCMGVISKFLQSDLDLLLNPNTLPKRCWWRDTHWGNSGRRIDSRGNTVARGSQIFSMFSFNLWNIIYLFFTIQPRIFNPWKPIPDSIKLSQNNLINLILNNFSLFKQDLVGLVHHHGKQSWHTEQNYQRTLIQKNLYLNTMYQLT